MLHYRIAETKDYKVLIQLWERSVDATHDFLQEAHKQTIKTNLPTYFHFVDLLVWYDLKQGLVGFSGTNGEHLEMLFLEPTLSGKGYGTEILQHLIRNSKVRLVDVNKQNKLAYRFYQKNGFEMINESSNDGQGFPYPILHLKLTDKTKNQNDSV